MRITEDGCYKFDSAADFNNWLEDNTLCVLEQVAKILPEFSQKKPEKFHYKIIVPNEEWTWYPAEYNPETREFFGCCKSIETNLIKFSLDNFIDLNAEIFKLSDPLTYEQILND
jgi:hypothetical protein